MNREELLPHLFRSEYGKIVAVLCWRFGFDRMGVAEDIASDTFLTAAQTWPLKGVPENPTAWLYAVAKNRAKNQIQRDALFERTIAPELRTRFAEPGQEDLDLSPQNIYDSQLRMMFALCHPSIPPEGQIALSLRFLCGFGIEEIADAFLASKDTINKRLFRAKERLRKEQVALDPPGDAEIDRRLDTVLTTIYLLFNEGYYSTSHNTSLRKDLCMEAMRLCSLLTENRKTDTPSVNAVLALMCFHASRFDARLDRNGEMVLYDDQDPGVWDAGLIGRGAYYLNRAATGNTVTRYHLEATIAYWHTQKADTTEKWENILQLYNQLLRLAYSPVAALNRTYALAKARGTHEAIREAEKLKLTDNQFYFALLGKLYSDVDKAKAREHYQNALTLARTETDKRTLQRNIDALSGA